ncbi:hypothetical protein JRQ81_000795 [Phrynocephalus forsythii]|uniref:Kinetochore scaffold 1 n=1 Tax=Phrynocephalus forsythii TaxID=171643 RepID=A0A9Q0Y600_9SAUR|nr:hypothetical protein JRQ81_000795 [Phrynocephalus forsythii]
MDRLHSEMNEEKDSTDRTNKRRISSILKAPRTPLRDLGSGNELIQECIVEKPQKNSRRVSFADTIKNDELEIVPCEITGMNTLLHAPIQTSLQQTEVFNANTGPEWNKMDKTLIFSEENEMDMTSGCTIMITHDIRNCQETDNNGKIDFKLFSAELKSKKEASQVTKFSFFSGPTMMSDTCLSQHKINTENTQKVNFEDFLKSLKSTKQLPMPPADLVSSGENVLQEKKYNAITVSKGLNDNKQNHIIPIFPNKGISLTSKQLGLQEMTPAAQKESVEMFISNRERGLPLGTIVCNTVNEQENLQRNHSMGCSMNSNRVNASNYPLGIHLNPSMCVNEKNLSRTEASVDRKNSIMVMKSDTSLPCYRTSTLPVPAGSDKSMPGHTIDATTFFNFSECMEVTRNDTGLIWEGIFKRTGYADCGDPEKQNKGVSQLERMTYKENRINISTDSFLKNPQHSVFNSEKTALNQEVTTNMELLKPRRNPISQASDLHERKEKDGFCDDKPSRSSVFFPKNESLNCSLVSNSSKKQRDCQLLSLSDDKTQTSAVHNKINRKSGLSNSAVSLIPEDKTVTLICNQNMEITKCTTDLTNNNPDAPVFQNILQEEMGSSTKSVTRSDSNKTVVFSLNGYNEMEITKSHTVPVNFDMVHCGRMPQPLPLQPIDKTPYVYHSDMDETKAITGIIDQPMKNANPEMHKQTSDSVRRTLSGSTKDRTMVFSLSDENAMEISRSHTVALDHDAVTQGAEIPMTSFVPSNKINAFSFYECMDITNPVAGLTDKSMRNVNDSFAVLEQKAKHDERISGVAGGTIIHSMSEDNETKLIDNLMVTVKGAPQALSSVLPDKTMYVHSSSMAKVISCLLQQTKLCFFCTTMTWK